MDPGGEPFARLADFATLMAGDASAVPLAASALAMSAVLQGRSTSAAVAVLDRLAAACTDRSFEGVRRHLYDDLAFTGDTAGYDHPRNSFLDVVLERRRGIPISLATVFIEVAGRVGVGAVGVGMPLHFMVRAGDDEDAFVDPFTGVALDRAGVRHHFESRSGGALRWADGFLDPTPARLIVARMLANLAASYDRRRDRLGRGLVALMRAAIPELGPAAQAEAVRLGAILN